MGESIGRIMDAVTEFCRQHLNILMIAGAVAVLLIIIIAVVISARKKDDQDDLDFDEEKFLKEKAGNSTKIDSPTSASSPSSPTSPSSASGTGSTAGPASATDTTNPVAGTQANPEAKAKDKERQTNIYIKTTDSKESIAALLSEITGIPAQALEEVEIKIQGAEVKIKYSPRATGTTAKDTRCDISIEELAREIEKAQAEAEEIEKTGDAELREIAEALCADKPEDIDEERGFILPEGNPNPEAAAGNEQPKSEKDRTVKKFGPDNNDTTRSGRVFTEEELKKQIKD